MGKIEAPVPADLVIRGGRIVGGSLITPPAWVAVKSGKIVAIGSGDSYPQAERTIDATGKYVLPGFIDPEQHPCSPIEEHIFSETRAAVATGITTAGLMSTSPRLYKSPPEIHSADDVPSNLEAFPQFFEMIE